MMFNLAYLFRACLSCGRMPDPTNSYFCQKCWRALIGDFVCGQIHVERQKATALVLWHRQNDLRIRALVTALKQGRRRLLSQKIAGIWLAKALSKRMKIPHRPVVVPAPPRKRNHRDHAWVLAREIADVIPGAELHSVLTRTSRHSQKNRGREERRLVSFEYSAPIPPDRPVLFVDDVITTGATAVAAYNALNTPKSFHIWALAYRCRLP